MVSGFTITRNAMRAGYPIVEAILSVLPLCDEFVVLDDSVDNTPAVIQQLAVKYGKIRLISRPWPIKEQRDGALATATNWAIEATKGDWLVYVQADEVFHEDVLPRLQAIIAENKVNAVAFHRMQLAMNFQEMHGEHWVVRLGKRGKIRSDGDALSFAVADNNYLVYDQDPARFQLFDITRCYAAHFPQKAYGQAEIWWHLPNRNAAGWYGKTPEEWAAQVLAWEQDGYPELWTKTDSPFKAQLPKSMQGWVGQTTYFARPELVR